MSFASTSAAPDLDLHREVPASRPEVVGMTLESRTLALFARVLLTFMFWGSGLAKLLDPAAGIAEMAHFGLAPPAAYLVAVIVCQLGGSALVIRGGRLAWLGAGALGVFTVLTIPIAHSFWLMDEPMRTLEFHVVVEHLCMVGGLMLAAILCHQRST